MVTSTDTSLALSGVMPRRNELPSPSPSHLVNRVFKVIFLGELEGGVHSKTQASSVLRVQEFMLWKMWCFALQSIGSTNHKFPVRNTECSEINCIVLFRTVVQGAGNGRWPKVLR